MLSRSLAVVSTVIALVLMPSLPADAANKPRKHKQPRVVYASQQVPNHYRGADKFPAGPLYFNGSQYLGDDPDPFIRSQLWRDLGAHFGGDN
ncbi:MAG TPA: hypothetical protein VI251_11730 [Pseudolabrys sp.]|jgi:hypothetical protein